MKRRSVEILYKTKGDFLPNGLQKVFCSFHPSDISHMQNVTEDILSVANCAIFYHPCLDEEYPRKEEDLWDLIYREIDAREWFVYCKSPQSEKSDNVLRERKYIEQSGKNKIWMLDMTESWDAIATKIHKICADLEVFISYTRQDRQVAEVL